MMRTIAEWAWRAGLLGALVWIGMELHVLRLDVEAQPDAPAVASSAEEDQDAVEAIRDDLAEIKQKVNAIMIVMARAK